MTVGISRRQFVAAAAATIAASGSAEAAWPDRPITIYHGFAAGGNADVVARIVGEALSRELSASVVVEPRPGAGGTVAAALVARASTDGYALGVLPGGHAVSAALYKQLNYRPIEDFNWISMINDFPFLITTYRDHPAKTMKEMIALARTSSQPLLWGSAGNGTGQHMSGELLGAMAGVKLQHVPYKGGAESMLDLLGKRLDFMVEAPTALVEHVKKGDMRALAFTGKSRFFLFPDVPTVAEAVAPGYETSSWLGLVGPAGLPQDIADKLNAALARILKTSEVDQKLRQLGSEASPTSSIAFRERVTRDIDKWNKVVESAKIERI